MTHHAHVGPIEFGALLEQAEQEADATRQQAQQRAMSRVRVGNILGVHHSELTPSQLHLADAVQRGMGAQFGPVRRLHKRGGFRLPRESWDE